MSGDSEQQEIISTVQEKIQNILDHKFSERYRRKIDIYHDRLNFCCPYCGDSRTDSRKKRGNLYFSDMGYHCFNCGEHAGIKYMLNHFGEELSSEDQVTIHTIQQSSKRLERRTASTQSSITFAILDKLAVPKSVFFKMLGLTTPFKCDECGNYLRTRKIEMRNWKHFAFNNSTKELYILNLTPTDRIIGFQVRQLDPASKKPRYNTSNITRMYNDVIKRDLNPIVEKVLSTIDKGDKYIEEQDGIENIVYEIDKISGLFNVMNANLSQTLTIVEGPIDSLAIPNCIALQGATNQNDYFDNIETVRYLFDNDEAGKRVTLQKLKNHKNVFLWEQYLKQENIKVKIKDVNDLQKVNGINWNTFDNCFSDDELDVMMI